MISSVSSASLKPWLALFRKSSTAFDVVVAGIDLVRQLVAKREVGVCITPQQLVDGHLGCGEAERRTRGEVFGQFRDIANKRLARRRELVHETNIRCALTVDPAATDHQLSGVG